MILMPAECQFIRAIYLAVLSKFGFGASIILTAIVITANFIERWKPVRAVRAARNLHGQFLSFLNGPDRKRVTGEYSYSNASSAAGLVATLLAGVFVFVLFSIIDNPYVDAFRKYVFVFLCMTASASTIVNLKWKQLNIRSSETPETTIV